MSEKVKIVELQPRLLSPAAAAEYLGMKLSTFLYRTLPKSTNPLPFPRLKVGKLVLYDLRDLDSFIEQVKSEGGEGE